MRTIEQFKFTHPASGVQTTLGAYLRMLESEYVPVEAFGSLANPFNGNNTGNDAVPIQAAIDYAYANSKQGVRAPSGAQSRTTATVYLDAPRNLRSSLTVPTNFAFSLSFVGGSGLGNTQFDGFTIRPSAGGRPHFVVGPGQGMHVRGLNVHPPTPATRATLIPADLADIANVDVGIGISGGSGGASRTLVENCWVENCYRGFATGFNRDTLADSTTFTKCMAHICYEAFNFVKPQNYINSLIDCSVSECKKAVTSTAAKLISVSGANNFSAGNAPHRTLTIVSVSAGRSGNETLLGAGYKNSSFDVVISGMSATDLVRLAAGDYDIFGIPTADHGYVPCVMTGWNSGTSTLSLKFYPEWVIGHWGFSFNFTTSSGIFADLAASTEIDMAEQVFVFADCAPHGQGIIHVENPLAVTTLIRSHGTAPNLIDGLYCNYDPAHSESKADATNKSLFRLQSVFPFIYAKSMDVSFTNCDFGQTTSDEPIMVQSMQGRRLSFDDPSMGLMFNPNVRTCIDQTSITGDGFLDSSRARGCGEWAKSPFYAREAVAETSDRWRRHSFYRHPHRGYLPSDNVSPSLKASYYTVVSGSLSGVDRKTYPPIPGHTLIRVRDWDAGAPGGFIFALSDHDFYSYGQNISDSWDYRGGSAILNVTSTAWAFAGLKIGLDNGVTTSWYVITGVFPNASYVTVCKALDNTAPRMDGVAGTNYAGATILQEAYSFTQF